MQRPVLVIFAIVAALGAATASDARPRAEGPLQAKLARALTVPHVSRTQTSALVVDLRTGDEIFALNKGRALEPASNEKLAVAYAALEVLGPEFRIETAVHAEGELEGTTWKGNLVLKGYGDPTLSRGDLRRLARDVRALGIRHVAGAVVGDESHFDSRRVVAGWRPSFYIRESPPLSALVVDRGRYRGYVSRNPALTAAAVFREELRASGVSVAGSVRLGRAADEAPVAYVESPPLAPIVRFMGVESDNFTAELLLKQLGAVAAGRGTSAAGAAVVTQTLRDAGVPVTGVRIVDGSGLSRLNRLTATALVALLNVARAHPELRTSFVRSLAVAGLTGTLRHRLRAPLTRGRVLAKTGTTRVASALSGYVKDRYAFAILQNGRPVSSWWARRAQDRFVTVLAAQ